MVKALGDNCIGFVSDLIIVVELAIKGPDGKTDKDRDGVIVGDSDDDAPEVISMSFGGEIDVPEFHDMLKTAYGYGIVLVTAAGNEGASSPSYPAAYSEVIAVGAIDKYGNMLSWSNRNPEVAAPGVSILSTHPDDTYETLQGTSMACPYVSATVALIQAAVLAKNGTVLPPETVRQILHDTAIDLGAPSYDELYRYGVVNAYAAVKRALSS